MTIRTIDELRRLRRYQAADPDRAVDQTSSGPLEGGGGPLRLPSGEGQSMQSAARPPDAMNGSDECRVMNGRHTHKAGPSPTTLCTIPPPRSGAAYS